MINSFTIILFYQPKCKEKTKYFLFDKTTTKNYNSHTNNLNEFTYIVNIPRLLKYNIQIMQEKITIFNSFDRAIWYYTAYINHILFW